MVGLFRDFAIAGSFEIDPVVLLHELHDIGSLNASDSTDKMLGMHVGGSGVQARIAVQKVSVLSITNFITDIITGGLMGQLLVSLCLGVPNHIANVFRSGYKRTLRRFGMSVRCKSDSQ